MFSARIGAAITTAIGAGALGLALATAGSAGANTADDAFIARMTAVGVTFDSPQAAVEQGHQVCQELASGRSTGQIAAEIITQTNLTATQAASFVVNATDVYCPRYGAITV